ncbi:MAG: hypothetical protein GY788_01695 [bacterium]|nr:hypothetical protein [bacterium]
MDSSPVLGPKRLRWLCRPFAPVFGLCGAHAANSKIATPDVGALEDKWRTLLGTGVADTSAIGVAYQGANAREARVEAKAIGLLQVVVIAFAALAIVLTQDGLVLRLFVCVSLAFLCLATAGSVEALRIRPRPQLLSRAASSTVGSFAEMGAAAEAMETLSIRTSNFFAGALRDLVWGGVAALAALIVLLSGLTDDGEPAQVDEMPAVSTTDPCPHSPGPAFVPGAQGRPGLGGRSTNHPPGCPPEGDHK